MADNENTYIATEYIRDGIGKCEGVDELRKTVFPMIKSQQEQWKGKINSLIEQSGYTKVRFSKACKVTRQAVNKWCNGSLPNKRETYIRIGLTAGYDREGINRLLQRYGQFPGLYPKSLADCVCIYVVERYSGDEMIEKYDYILDMIKESITGTESNEQSDMDTQLFDEKLSDVKDEDELENFVQENGRVFAGAYHRFYAYVKMHIAANYEDFGGTVFELAEGQEWSSSLRQCVSAIRQNKWFPTRNKIISLGLHLSMDHDQIDEMLELAHMEPLCAKNIFESIIIFILEDAALNNMLDTESEEFDPDALINYAGEILRELDIPEVLEFIKELPETDYER